jgi:predicted ATPase
VDHNATAEAYLPVLDALGDLCRDAETDDIIAVLERHAPSWLMQLPALTDHEKRRRLSQQMGEISQERMLRELAGALETIAQRKPVVLFLEDLHWSDVASVDLLAYIARRPERARIIIVATYRPVDVILRKHPLKKLKQSLLAHGLCEDIPLELLDPMAVNDYLALRFPHCDQLERLVPKVFEQTEGNPLFMINLATFLVDRSYITEQAGVWRLQQDLETVGISDNLRGMIVQQLENQAPADQELLKVMSVVGRRPTLAEIAAAMTLPEEAIETRCEQLEQCSVFIRFRGVEEWPDGTVTGGYEFNHALYQNVLYDQLSALRRMRLHLAIGKRLAQAFQADRALDVAEHFTQGRDYEHAIEYWRLAAETTLQRQAYHEAATHLEQGLALLDGIRDREHRLRLELELRMTLGPVLIAKRGNASRHVGQSYRRACELCELLHDDAQLFPALFGLRSYYQFSDQLQRAHEASQQLLQLAERTGNEDHRLEAYVAMASTHYFLGQLQEGSEFAEMGIRLYDPVRHRNHASSYGMDPGVFCRSRYAQVSWLLGFPDRAVMEIGNALSLAESIEHPYSLIFAVHNATSIHLFRLDAKAALASAHQGYRLANQYNFAFLFGWASYLLAWAHALAGDSESALKQSVHALALKVPESRTTRDFLQVYLAETYYHLGMPLLGLQALDEAALSGQEFFYAGERARLRGEFLLMQGNHQQAEIHFIAAVEQNAEMKAAAFRLRAALSLAKLWLEVGKTSSVHKLLTENCRTIVAVEPDHDLKLAAMLLAKQALTT